MSLLGLRGLLASADRGGAADDIRLDALQLHLAQQLQALQPRGTARSPLAKAALIAAVYLMTSGLILCSCISRGNRRPCSSCAPFSQALLAEP